MYSRTSHVKICKRNEEKIWDEYFVFVCMTIWRIASVSCSLRLALLIFRISRKCFGRFLSCRIAQPAIKSLINGCNRHSHEIRFERRAALPSRRITVQWRAHFQLISDRCDSSADDWRPKNSRSGRNSSMNLFPEYDTNTEFIVHTDNDNSWPPGSPWPGRK